MEVQAQDRPPEALLSTLHHQDWGSGRNAAYPQPCNDPGAEIYPAVPLAGSCRNQCLVRDSCLSVWLWIRCGRGLQPGPSSRSSQATGPAPPHSGPAVLDSCRGGNGFALGRLSVVTRMQIWATGAGNQAVWDLGSHLDGLDCTQAGWWAVQIQGLDQSGDISGTASRGDRFRRGV